MSHSAAVQARHSIRWRFTFWISVLLLVAGGAAFVLIYRETSDRLSAQINQDLAGDTTQLEQSLNILRGVPASVRLSRLRRYVDAQAFGSISTLLFVLDAGPQPISNFPEVFEQAAPDDGEAPQQQEAENRLAATISRPRVGTSTLRVPDVGRVRVLERAREEGGMHVVIGAGEPLATLTRAQAGIVHSFLLAGTIVALAVLLGVYLVGTKVTAPLRRMIRVAAEVDAGDLKPRMEDPGQRQDEVGLLATTFNHMLQRLEKGFQGQREFIAEASHELRTPLTVIQGQLEVLANRHDVDRDEVRRVERLVRAEVQRMRRIVDDLFFLAQTERPNFLQCETLDSERFLTQIWDGATLTAERRFELGPLPAGRLRADPDRLAQAIRNLVNNAVEHTRPGDGLVRLQARASAPDLLLIEVSDDGPGIPPAERERIFDRFHRTLATRARNDGVSGGAGLGLSIVRAIVEAHGGRVSLLDSDTGSGARFQILLPNFTVVSQPAVLPPRAPIHRERMNGTSICEGAMPVAEDHDR